MMIKRNLSGRAWWQANQDRYPNSRRLEDLEPGFRTRIEGFIGALHGAGAAVRISSTLRNPIRAHLMHYSWKVAHGMIEPDQVPTLGGLDIAWDHGDADASKEAAMEMVRLFNMVHIAALRSNHTSGKAIDMDIGWKDKLVLRMPLACGVVEIGGRPRNGQNRELHLYGEQHYGVRKLRSDPPHWSINGR
jgi:hypothetical protein